MILDLVQTDVPFSVCSQIFLLHGERLNVMSRSSNQARLAHQRWQGVGWPYLSPDLNPTQHRDAVDLLHGCGDDISATSA